MALTKSLASGNQFGILFGSAKVLQASVKNFSAETAQRMHAEFAEINSANISQRSDFPCNLSALMVVLCTVCPLRNRYDCSNSIRKVLNVDIVIDRHYLLM
jgi:hypothetical protein